jgi:hypothetical protein
VLDVIGPSGVAVQLARMPDVVARLLAEHVPDQRGRCRGCGFPGTGTPYVPSPCGLWLVADAAQRIARHDKGGALPAMDAHARRLVLRVASTGRGA